MSYLITFLLGAMFGVTMFIVWVVLTHEDR